MKRGSLKLLVGHQRTDAPLHGMRGGLGERPLIRDKREEKPLPVIRRVAGYDTLSRHLHWCGIPLGLVMPLPFHFPAQFIIAIIFSGGADPTNRQTVPNSRRESISVIGRGEMHLVVPSDSRGPMLVVERRLRTRLLLHNTEI